MLIERQEVLQRYSQVVKYQDTVYLSGVVPTDLNAGMEEQASEVFAKIDQLLATAGASKSTLLSMQCFVSSFDEFDAFNTVYDSWIDPEAKPARATVEAALYDPRVKVEIVCIAAAT